MSGIINANTARIAHHGRVVRMRAQPPQNPPSRSFGDGRRKAGMWTDSMCDPTMASTAGSSVSAASTAVITATAAE
jgi:hypothetical protein